MRYPAFTSRPEFFTLTPREHPLKAGLVFAGLGGHPWTTRYHDSSPYGNHGTLTTMDPPTDWLWDATLNRWVIDFDGSSDYIPLTTAVRYANPNILTAACWVKMTPTPATARRQVIACENEASVFQLEVNSRETVTANNNVTAIVNGEYVTACNPGWTAN